VFFHNTIPGSPLSAPRRRILDLDIDLDLDLDLDLDRG
jgi:hypothetical protein